MKSSPLWKSISCLLSQVIQGKGKAAEEVPPGEFTHTLQLVSGVSHPSHNTAAFPNAVLLLSETGGVHASPLAGLPVEVFQGPGLSLPHSRPLPQQCSRLAVPPVRHPAVAPSKAFAASRKLCMGKSFIFLSLPRHVLSLNFYVCNSS